MLAGRDPVPLGGGVDLENMGPSAEDRLLPGGGNTGGRMRYGNNYFWEGGDLAKRQCSNPLTDFRSINYDLEVTEPLKLPF